MNDTADIKEGFSDSELKRLLESVAMITSCEDIIVQRYNEDQMKTPMHMSVGDESCVVGVVESFKQDAYFFGYYRTHSLYLAVARDPYKFFAELLGKKTGSNGGIAGSMHMSSLADGLLYTSAIVASTIPLALGAALANKNIKKKKYSVVFFGDGAIEEGVFHETLNMAALFQLPILFVCLDNGLAVDLEAPARQGFKSIESLAKSYKCNYLHADNPTVTDAYAVGLDAKRFLDMSQKPVFLHMTYYRYLQHIGITDDFTEASASTFEKKDYRSIEAHREYMKKKPLDVAVRELKAAGWQESDIEEIITNIRQKSLDAYSRALVDQVIGDGKAQNKVFF